MSKVKCFRYDSWVDVDVLEMESGDIYAHQGQTYITTGKPYMSKGQTNIPSQVYNSGPIVIAFPKGQDYIHMAMDYVCSPAHDFGDGTMQICDFSDGITHVYSPRLPISELNEFCKANIARYESFFDKHERKLDSGSVIEMPKFW